MWYTATSASVTNGATVVAITTGDDISIIQEDSGLIFEGESPVQVKLGYIDGSGDKFIQLASPWPYTEKTNQPLVAFPTDASFAEATAELRRVIDTLSVASTVEAQEGTDDEKIMTPLKTKQAIDFNTGTAASKNIVTSTTDTTAGRLLTVGYAGIGASSILVSDFDNLTVNGCYQSLLGSTVGAPLAGRQYTLWHNAFGTGTGNDRASQIAVETLPTTSTSPMYFRTREAGVWGEWQEIYDSGNTNFTTFRGGNVGGQIGSVVYRNTNTLFLVKDISGYINSPSSITCTGTFKIVNQNGASMITGITAADLSMESLTSSKRLKVRISNVDPSLLTFGGDVTYELAAETADATIEANL